MGYIGKASINNTTYPIGATLYGTCNTAAATVEKAVTCADFDTFITGVTIHVWFAYGNTATSPTLNVNSKGAKAIKLNGDSPGAAVDRSWPSGAMVSFTYDGTSWHMSTYTNTRYSAMTGAGASTAGTSGLVPAPASGDNAKFLRGDGTWAEAGGGSGGGASTEPFYHGKITAISSNILTATVDGYTSYTAGDVFILYYPTSVSNIATNLGDAQLKIKINNLTAYNVYHYYNSSSDYITYKCEEAVVAIKKDTYFIISYQQANVLVYQNEATSVKPIEQGVNAHFEMDLLGVTSHDGRSDNTYIGPFQGTKGCLVYRHNYGQGSGLYQKIFDSNDGTKVYPYVNTFNYEKLLAKFPQVIHTPFVIGPDQFPRFFTTIDQDYYTGRDYLAYDYDSPLITCVGRIWLVDETGVIYRPNLQKMQEYYENNNEYPAGLPYFVDPPLLDGNDSTANVSVYESFEEKIASYTNNYNVSETNPWNEWDPPYVQAIWEMSADSWVNDYESATPLTMSVTNSSENVTILDNESDSHNFTLVAPDPSDDSTLHTEIWNVYVDITNTDLIQYCDIAAAFGFYDYLPPVTQMVDWDPNWHQGAFADNSMYGGLVHYFDASELVYKLVPPNALLVVYGDPDFSDDSGLRTFYACRWKRTIISNTIIK